MRADLIERLREIAYRDSAKNVTVRAEDLRDVLDALASPSSPQEPVAWQWRYRDWAGSLDGTNKWSEWLPGRMPETRPIHEDREERALVVASPVVPVAAKAEEGTTLRICPMRDAVCPWGMSCPFVGDGYHGYPCKEGWRNRPAPAGKGEGQP